MLRKDIGSFPRILGLAYAFFQCLGAFCGALISWFLVGGYYGLTNDSTFENMMPGIPTIGLLMPSNGGSIFPSCTWSTTQVSTLPPNYKYECSHAGFVFGAMLAEALGSFFVAFFFLTQTEEKTLFSKEKAINCFIIASSYIGARGMLNGRTVTQSGAVLNPAIAIGTSFTMMFENGGSYFRYVWIYALLPLAGAILAVIFHEFVFKKTQEVMA